MYVGKLFRSKDILLLGLAHLLDFTEEVRDPFHLLSYSYKNMYGWVPKQYQKHNFYQLLSRSYKAKFIDRVQRDGKTYIRITSEGKKTIERDFPMLSLQDRQWDGKWRIVMFDIEEVNRQARERLRAKLKELGFGMLQKSVFISPHDLLKDFSEFAESSGIKNYLYLLETHKLIVGDEREFANRIWKLNDLNEKYKTIIDEISGINKIKNGHMVSNSGRMKKSDIGMDKDVRNLVNSGNAGNSGTLVGLGNSGNLQDLLVNVRNAWLRDVISDPFLPKKFLPIPWYGDEARKLVRGGF